MSRYCNCGNLNDASNPYVICESCENAMYANTLIDFEITEQDGIYTLLLNFSDYERTIPLNHHSYTTLQDVARCMKFMKFGEISYDEMYYKIADLEEQLTNDLSTKDLDVLLRNF